MRLLLLLLLALALPAQAQSPEEDAINAPPGAAARAPAPALPPAPVVTVTTPPDNDGLNLTITWEDSAGELGYAILRAPGDSAEWTLVKMLPADTTTLSDKVTTNVIVEPPAERYQYQVLALASLPLFEGDVPDAEKIAQLRAVGAASAIAVGAPKAAWLRTGEGTGNRGSLLMLVIIAAMGVMMWKFAEDVRAGKPVFIRRIPGIDAIEEGIGRATEMGKPILYVPGIDELQDIQTIASMLILGQVSKKVAEYQSDIIVSCCIPMVREVADEVVKAGFYQAGFPDAYNPRNTRFISSEQFAFCAGTNGIIYREQPATNIYLGRFFAESLILAETGFVNKSIQIAGTAEATQLPFFIAACDYTLIGEELFAVSAYLSKDPRLVSSLKASDYIKVFAVVSLLLGTVLATFGSDLIINLFSVTGG